MSTEVPSTPPRVTLTREQLLEALDKDIESMSASQSAAGWNHWAILGALAGLIWLALNAWDNGHFLLPNVLLLALAISLSWDWLCQVATRLDSSPLTLIKASNRFWSLPGILGTSRTSILWECLKNLLWLAMAFSSKSPFLPPVKVYLAVAVPGLLLALALSYWDDCPEISTNQKYLPPWFVSAMVILLTVLPAAMAMLAWGALWLGPDKLTTHDWRLALLTSALIYLVTLAIQRRIPTTFLSAFRAIRSNLAYGRISLADAQCQADILSIGGTLDQTLQPHLRKIIEKLERTRMALLEARQLAVKFAESVASWASQPKGPESHAKQLASVEVQKQFFQKLDEAFLVFKQAEKLRLKFQDRHKHLTTFATPDPGDSIQVLLQQLKAKAEDLQVSFQQSHDLIITTHAVIAKWREENEPQAEVAAPLASLALPIPAFPRTEL